MKKQQSFIPQAKAILFQVSKKKPNHLTSEVTWVFVTGWEL